MFAWLKRKFTSDYMRRQVYMMSSLGLFYIIIIALFAIPLLGAFVVVLIKGVMDFRYLILGAGIILLALAIYYGCKFALRFFRKVRRDGFLAIGDARTRAGHGEPVAIDFFNGLLTFSYGGRRPRSMLPGLPGAPDSLNSPESRESLTSNDPASLIADSFGESVAAEDPVRQLRELSALKEEGIIDADEFQRLKTRLIRNFCEPEEEKEPSPVSK